MQRTFAEVDVFTAVPYLGNPLAVVLDGSDLTAERDAALRPLDEPLRDHVPAAAHRPRGRLPVRIFTATTELPFAGHPTIGSCHAWLANGGTPAHPDGSCSSAASVW